MAGMTRDSGFKRIARATLLAAAFAAAGAAHAEDLLSGRYFPRNSAEGEVPLIVQSAGAGWTATFNGEPRTLQPVSGEQLDRLFPGMEDSMHPQCAASAKLLLCHVDPGTRFEGANFVSSTGYFALFVDGGAFELDRQPD